MNNRAEAIRPYLVTRLREAIEAEDKTPSRRNILQSIEDIASASRHLSECLTDELIQDAGLASFQDCLQVIPFLSDISEAATNFLEKNSSKNGAGNIMLRSNFNPFQLCALYGLIVRQWHTGRWGGHETSDLQQWCEALWREAGGKHPKSVREPWRSWRRHLTAARLLRGSDATKERVENLAGKIAALARIKSRRSDASRQYGDLTEELLTSAEVANILLQVKSAL